MILVEGFERAGEEKSFIMPGDLRFLMLHIVLLVFVYFWFLYWKIASLKCLRGFLCYLFKYTRQF